MVPTTEGVVDVMVIVVPFEVSGSVKVCLGIEAAAAKDPVADACPLLSARAADLLLSVSLSMDEIAAELIGSTSGPMVRALLATAIIILAPLWPSTVEVDPAVMVMIRLAASHFLPTSTVWL